MSKELKPINILQDIHSCFINAPIILRDRICEECSMSTPTFYRKMRMEDRQEKGRIYHVLSNAEKECIIKIAELIIAGINKHLDKYRGFS